jgi:hypothetical protein
MKIRRTDRPALLVDLNKVNLDCNHNINGARENTDSLTFVLDRTKYIIVADSSNANQSKQRDLLHHLGCL